MARNVNPKTTFVRDLSPGQGVDDLFLAADAKQGQSRNGPYWNLTLMDRSGRMEAKIWSPLSQEFADIPTGSLVRVKGSVGSFRDRPQITVERMAVLDQAATDFNAADYLPSSAVAPEEMLDELDDLLSEHLTHKPWKNFCRKVLRDENIRQGLLRGAGAKTVHHAYLGGLLEHTLAVARMCMAICDRYPALDRQILLVAAAFHDLGKAWELSNGPAADYTDEGRLLGHILMGLERLEPFLTKARDLDAELVLHLRHIILSHHGEYEYGSPRRPKTAEAFVLHYADNLDAKLNTVFTAFAEIDGAGQQWTPFQRYLDRYLYRPSRTPDERHGRKKNPENQCLLPLKA